ncbi:MAG: hypothetical protein JOZ33_09135 [Acidobacteriaceae bacterium]|nr:hypothetical protein [Acidobacteriaceae bacterium]
MSVLRAIFRFFYEIFFGCSHGHLTRIFTLQDETYRVCLDCGVHIPYSPVSMRPLSGRELRRMRAARAGELKIVPAGVSAAPLQSAERKSSVA